ncbi:MAG: LOG family protein [Chlamydiales bacterium]|nr:LOG family protein [Chlamydiales bacterium]
MESYLNAHHYDLVTPDGLITDIQWISDTKRVATVCIKHISPAFIGYEIEPQLVYFNVKSTLAQLGINGVGIDYEWDRSQGLCYVKVELIALGELAKAMLALLRTGAYIGKIFAADERRRVRDPDYLMRMFGRSDRKGRPLLSLGGLEGSRSLILEKIGGRTVAFISLLDGVINYEPTIYGLLPILAKALMKNLSQTRQLIHLDHYLEPALARLSTPGQTLLVRTAPLHIRTVYARVVDHLLPKGYHHFSANVLQPDTFDSGDIYELYGASNQIIDDIPLEFYTLEPHREHIFFSDRDQLQTALENPKSLFEAFATAPEPKNHLAAIFVVKGTQLLHLQSTDWIIRDPYKYEFPGLAHPARQTLVVEKYIEHQPAYPFLQAIENGLITSQGILLCRHFPTPLLKRMLLSDLVQRCLKRIYFQYPSATHGDFFSQEDRAMLVDLAKFGIPVFWVDHATGKILQYSFKTDKETGMFVPLPLVEDFRKATVFGVYGSNLMEGNFEKELRTLLSGVLEMRDQANHPLLCKGTPLAVVTGGGPGAMALANRVARSLNILSCANIVDFRPKDGSVVNEQKQNEYIDGKMTYRLDRLVERQAEFYLDFPILLPGGIGTDFEYALEEVRRKTGGCPANPILLFGEEAYWREKVTSRFRLNCATGTIKGSEWISNCFYCVQTAKQGLAIYKKFFEGKLLIGKEGPVYEEGFCTFKSRS